MVFIIADRVGSTCSGQEHFSCKNGRCIDKHRYCDHIDDCGDKSDEPTECQYNICQTQNHGCSQNCHWNGFTHNCSCFSGYKLAADGRTCEDVDECHSILGVCSGHNCTNLPGHYKCSCLPGFELESHRFCRSTDKTPPELLLADIHDIRILKLAVNRANFTNYDLLYKTINDSYVLDYNLRHNYIITAGRSHVYIARLDQSRRKLSFIR